MHSHRVKVINDQTFFTGTFGLVIVGEAQVLQTTLRVALFNSGIPWQWAKMHDTRILKELDRTQPSIILLLTSLLFLSWHVKMLYMKKAYCMMNMKKTVTVLRSSKSQDHGRTGTPVVTFCTFRIKVFIWSCSWGLQWMEQPYTKTLFYMLVFHLICLGVVYCTEK